MARITVIGANGGVGRHLVELALAEGHDVRAAARNPAKVIIDHERLQVVSCDALEPASIRPAVAGQDVVICALGSPNRGPTTLYSTGVRNVIEQMQVHHVRRLVFLSNFGVLGETARGLRQWLLLSLVRGVLRHTLADHRRAIAAMRQSDLEWIAVRPLPMTDGPWTGAYRVALDNLPHLGTRISRGDVADFMLAQITSDEYVHRVPAIAQ
jgi:putative NADH-flavin reductase